MAEVFTALLIIGFLVVYVFIQDFWGAVFWWAFTVPPILGVIAFVLGI